MIKVRADFAEMKDSIGKKWHVCVQSQRWEETNLLWTISTFSQVCEGEKTEWQNEENWQATEGAIRG